MTNENNTKDKEFKTLSEQIEILEKRNLIIENYSFVESVLLKENYYSIINGYKDLFLDSSKEQEQFKEGTKFEDIYALYLFDREIRSLILAEIVKYEVSLKTKIAYFFSEKYRGKYAYLYVENYNKNSIHSLVQTIGVLSRKITHFSGKKYKGKKSTRTQHPINYYINEYGYVPLWVLINFLTFGEIQYMYMHLDDDIKNKIANEFKKEYFNNYNVCIDFSSGDISEINQIFNLFRNVCAHEEKLYNYTLNRAVKVVLLKRNFEEVEFDGRRFFTMLAYLKFVTEKKDYHNLIDSIYKEIGRLKESSVNIGKLIYSMGLPSNWEKILK